MVTDGLNEGLFVGIGQVFSALATRGHKFWIQPVREEDTGPRLFTNSGGFGIDGALLRYIHRSKFFLRPSPITV